MDDTVAGQWKVIRYVWGMRAHYGHLIVADCLFMGCPHRPSGEDIRKRYHLSTTPVALVRPFWGGCDAFPAKTREWHDDFVPVCESVLEIMARLSK